MQKSTRVLLYALSGAIIVSAVGLSSCSKDDDEPKAKPVLTVSATAVTVNEDDGIIEIEVKLDKPATEDITIDYELSGTAQDAETATQQTDPADYIVSEDQDYGEIQIEKGETTGTIIIELFSDDLLENDESIVVELTDVDDAVELGADNETTVTVEQEDGILVYLSWPESGTDGVADMDLIIRIGKTKESPTWDGILTGSAFRTFQYNYEFVFLPKAFTGEFFNLGYTDTMFGLSYTYYDGTLDPLEFQVDFVEFTNGVLEDEEDADIFTGAYTADNLNKWVSASPPTLIAQTIRLNGGEFQDISDLTEPPTSSRVDVARMNMYLGNPSFWTGMSRSGMVRQDLLKRLNLQ